MGNQFILTQVTEKDYKDINLLIFKMRRYTNIALPDDLIAQIDNIIKKRGFGYKSRAEFTKEAVRNLLKEIKKNK